MSGPTKGMVAGQPITTGAQTKEFDEGYERIFGTDRKPIRGRFVYCPERGECVEVGADWTDTERRAQTITEELVYGKIQSTDGEDLSSRKKHREYMKRNGVTLASDYSDEYRQRAESRKEMQESKTVREAVERAWHNHTEKRRK
jgi:hypothetical protein